MAGCKSFEGRGLRQRSGLAPRFKRPCSPVRLLRIDRLSMPQQSKLQDRPRRSPAEVHAVALNKILRIQAAIASLGTDDIEERSSLEAVLSRAQHLLVIPPVNKRIEGTSVIARAKKRIAAESVKVEQAEKQRQFFEELAQAERDLEGF